MKLLLLVHELGRLDYLVGDVASPTSGIAPCIGCRPTGQFLASLVLAQPPILPTSVLMSSSLFCLGRECMGSQGCIGWWPIGTRAARLEALKSAVETSSG
jgi:hypothetical protein